MKDPTSLVLHRGINEVVAGSGNWQQPPQANWPARSVTFGDGKAVESPMSKHGDGTWSIKIVTRKIVSSIHYVFHTGNSGILSGDENWDWDMNILNGGHSWNFYFLQPLGYGSQQVELLFDHSSSDLSLMDYPFGVNFQPLEWQSFRFSR